MADAEPPSALPADPQQQAMPAASPGAPANPVGPAGFPGNTEAPRPPGNAEGPRPVFSEVLTAGGAPVTDTPMTLVDHLGELRRRIIRSILAIVVGAAIGFWFGDDVVAFLKAPLPISQPLIFTSIGDPFAIRLRIAIVGGIVLAMPVILYQGWAFVSPGLTAAERRAARPWVPFALLFFVMGVAIAYVILPFASQFLLSFQSDQLQPLLTARDYFDFVSTLFLAFGLLMEFPIVLVALSRVGVVTSGRLRSARRMVILGIAIFATAATPGGDLVSPTVLGFSMYILFELSILLIRRSGR